MTTAIDALINLSISFVISEQGNVHTLSVFQEIVESVLRGREPMEDIITISSTYTTTPANGIIFADATAGAFNINLHKCTEAISYTAGTTKSLTIKKTDDLVISSGGISIVRIS